MTGLTKLLDVIVGYDADDPATAFGVGHIPDTYAKSLDKNGLKGARIGILRESVGNASAPNPDNFKNVTALFEESVAELRAAGAEVVDPVVIPGLNELLAARWMGGAGGGNSASNYFSRNPTSPLESGQELRCHPDYARVRRRPAMQPRTRYAPPDGMTPDQARDELMTNVMKVMADHRLDAIVHKSNEHTPTLIKHGINPPYVNLKGLPHINRFLIFAASITVPSGFTADGLPVGVTFLGRPYSEPTMIKLAYAYEQSAHHRVPPKSLWQPTSPRAPHQCGAR